MITEVTAEHYIILATTLFVIGVAGVLIRRNAIVVLMCVELMLNAVNLLMVAFSSHHKDSAGQLFVFFYHGRCGGRSSRWISHFGDGVPKYAQHRCEFVGSIKELIEHGSIFNSYSIIAADWFLDQWYFREKTTKKSGWNLGNAGRFRFIPTQFIRVPRST